MVVIMFFLGFVADPILNLYTDPYETIVGHEDFWQEVDVNQSKDSLSGWAQHFLKGLVSMGVLSFLRTMILNPFQWWNLRNTGFVGGRVAGRSTTGRDRAVNISWFMVAMGVLSASYFFYQWVQTIISKSLQRIGNNIVDTHLPGDDDDLKPPPGFKFEQSYPQTTDSQASNEGESTKHPGENVLQPHTEQASAESGLTEDSTEIPTRRSYVPGAWESTSYSSAVDGARNQGWSFGGL